MREIEELERQWRRYRLKKLLPLFAISVLVVIVAAGWWYQGVAFTVSSPSSTPTISENRQISPSHSTPQKDTLPSQRKTLESPKPKKEKKREQTVVTKTQKRDKSVMIVPDTAFLESLETSSPPSSSKTGYASQSQRAKAREKVRPPNRLLSKNSSPTKTRSTPAGNAAGRENVHDASKQKESGKLLIQTKQTNNTLEYLIKRFNQTRDPKLASYIARSFYKKRNYDETIKWAVIANSIDPMGEESWILFAKAKVSQGKKEEAIKALQVYLNQYSSRRIRSYLETLESEL